MVEAVMYLLAEKTGAVIPPEEVEKRRAVLYDFRRPTTLSREHSRTLELAFETFARQWGTQLTARVRVLSSVTPGQVEMMTYDDYVASLPPATAMVLCTVSGSDTHAVLQFPAAGALNWVSHILGSPTATVAEERKFTRIEQTLISNLLTETLEDLHYSLGGLLKEPLAVGTIHHNAQFAQAAAKSDLMITAAFTVQVGEATVQSSLAIPAESVLPQLGEESTAVQEDYAEDALREHLVSVPMDLALAVTDTTITPAQVLNLAVGDVLPLPHPADRPLLLTVDGQRLGSAVAGNQSGRIAAVVVSTEESRV